MEVQSNFPDIMFDMDINSNPILSSPNSEYSIQFRQTKESFVDIELYKQFLDNAISRFRHSRTYKHYKGYLIDLGLNRCQLLPNINTEMDITIEMHHNFLTIYDIALMICEHVLNTVGSITTFELVMLLKEEHKNNRVPIVMLSKTAHQMFHNNEMVIPAQACFGFWSELLIKYYRGITKDIANKTILFLNKSLEIEKNNLEHNEVLLKLRDHVLSWSNYNEYAELPKLNYIMNY